MSKIAFFYLHGTDPLILQFIKWLGDVAGQVSGLGLLTVPGLNGVTTTWLDGSPRNDPFTNLLDPEIFEVKKVGYPALAVPMSVSMNIGITNVDNAIRALPTGQKFMLGGYSQGAACMSSIYTRLRSGSLSSYNDRFLGGVMFGNPRRQQDYRGPVGGTWSGKFDDPTATTGGHGSFPTTGPFARLTGCETSRWVEFTEEGDIFSSVGNSQKANNWVAANTAFLDLGSIAEAVSTLLNLGDVLDTAVTFGGVALSYVDAVGRAFNFPGNGHAAYPWQPPPGDPDNGLTSFQIAIKWLLSKAAELAVAPILLPSQPATPANAGWSTTLVPPAA